MAVDELNRNLRRENMNTTAVLNEAVPQTKTRAIERRSARDLPYELFLKEYLHANRPVIISDAAPQWNAMRSWTPEFFKSRYGSQVVNVSYETKMTMSDLIDAVMASTPEKPGPYLHKVIIYKDMPELLTDLSPENVYAFPRRYAGSLMPERFQRPDGYLKLLIGGAGGKFPLMHYGSRRHKVRVSLRELHAHFGDRKSGSSRSREVSALREGHTVSRHGPSWRLDPGSLRMVARRPRAQSINFGMRQHDVSLQLARLCQ
jgi:hypothetical protein